MIRFAALLAAALASAVLSAQAQQIAPTPPMGWNSWDAFGLTIDEAAFRANATVLAGLKSYGWNTAVIDEGWYMENPFGDKLETRKYLLDGNGMLLPVLARFPSAANGQGFKPLSDWLHGQGLKFGIHILRGIPKQAVHDNLPIAGSGFHAQDAADTSDLCPWDEGNYGIRDTPAGQAYYDASLKFYADWGVDFIKVDCISDHPYKGGEIRQIAEAIKKTGRPIVLSLSPGPTQLAHAAEVGRYAQMWRIADDTWDGWSFSPAQWPNGVLTGFDKLALWHSYAKPGNWPDADMLPFGALTPHPGWGNPRQSRLTVDEERTLFTLWAIARSPLILGGDLTKLDDFTRLLITNKSVIAVNQTAWESAPVSDLPKGFEHARVWTALAGPRDKPIGYLALFNLDDKPAILQATWRQLGLRGHSLRDLWTGKKRAATNRVKAALPPHGSVIYRVE